ncbi:hypothetical protein NIES4072_74320 [Nostoc commune NIES-4072]|uniref:Uncharacterized protein n=1 Tax=Nostoc commune NIES-4072 TaxID=2005467 RepID=A0A2R5FYC2_NOSCO|nr:hypothetical protein NIES4070_74310 [Nostoc commune HK-02]GBG23720.1 hypothetical protein NIES4072_74320 [Nostoc commune NIES-4072]
MQLFLRVIGSTLIGGLCGTLCFALLMHITAWLGLPDSMKGLTIINTIFGGVGGFIIGWSIGLVVVLTNSGTTRAMLIGASVGTVVAGIRLYIRGKEFQPFFVFPEDILFSVMTIVITAVIGSISALFNSKL